MVLLGRRRLPLTAGLIALVVVAVVVLVIVFVVRRPGSPAGPTAAPTGGPTARPTAGATGGPTGVRPVASDRTPPCDGPGRTTVKPLPVGTTDRQWEEPSPADDTTYDLSGVTSTAYPATRSPFAVGTGTPGLRTCVIGGTVRGAADPGQPWDLYHAQFNAACVKILARGWIQVRGLRCDDVEDGIRPEESAVNANNAVVYVSGTYLTRIRDDCLEDDYTIGGLLQDNLWEQCNTGISERPSGGRSWPTPPAEKLVLDHMLIGLYPTPHVDGGGTVNGENALFKWSDSGNQVVIKCSLFKVDAVSLNGRDAMGLPPRTVVDDSGCPGHPSTIVWLGGGPYPAPTFGLRVVSDPAVWQDAVDAWKTAHGISGP